MTLISVQALERLDAMVPESSHAQAEDSRAGGNFDLDQWLGECKVPVVRSGPWNGGRKLILNPCPWNPEHTNGAAYIVQFANGAIAAGCHHNGCADKDWHALREKYEPGWQPPGARGGAGGHSLSDLGNARSAGRRTHGSLPAIGKRQGSAGTDRRARLGIRGRTPIGRLDGARVATAHCGALTPHLARESGSEKHVHAHGLGHTHAAS